MEALIKKADAKVQANKRADAVPAMKAGNGLKADTSLFKSIEKAQYTNGITILQMIAIGAEVVNANADMAYKILVENHQK